MSIDNLTPLPEAILDLRREVDRDIKSYARMMRDRAAERISELESTRLAAQLLDGLGLEVEGYGRLAWLRVELGHFPNSHRGNRRLALAWRKLRRALSLPAGAAGHRRGGRPEEDRRGPAAARGLPGRANPLHPAPEEGRQVPHCEAHLHLDLAGLRVVTGVTPC